MKRVLSIDLLRGLDVLLMLFVNEVAGVRGAPAFLRHAPRDVDGMTVTDVVFPAFLFIIGMALPFALPSRLARGRAEAWRHVLARTLALLLMGVLMVNAERASDELLPAELWNVLMTVAVVLAWQAPWGEPGSTWPRRLRALGVVLLVMLAVAYRTHDVAGPIQLRPHWWGILGLLGWAYLVAASVCLLAGERVAVIVAGVALLYCLYLADEAGRAAWLVSLRPYLSLGRAVAAHAAIALSGAVLGTMLLRHRREGRSPGSFVGPALGCAAALGAAGLLLHALRGLDPAFWINKVQATPPWCLLSSALTCVTWVVVFVLVDVRGFERWTKAVSVAGENALVAYFLAPFLLALFSMSAGLFGGTSPYELLSQPVWLGIVRSALFAWLVVRLCGLLRSRGVRLQL